MLNFNIVYKVSTDRPDRFILTDEEKEATINFAQNPLSDTEKIALRQIGTDATLNIFKGGECTLFYKGNVVKNMNPHLALTMGVEAGWDISVTGEGLPVGDFKRQLEKKKGPLDEKEKGLLEYIRMAQEGPAERLERRLPEIEPRKVDKNLFRKYDVVLMTDKTAVKEYKTSIMLYILKKGRDEKNLILGKRKISPLREEEPNEILSELGMPPMSVAADEQALGRGVDTGYDFLKMKHPDGIGSLYVSIEKQVKPIRANIFKPKSVHMEFEGQMLKATPGELYRALTLDGTKEVNVRDLTAELSQQAYS